MGYEKKIVQQMAENNQEQEKRILDLNGDVIGSFACFCVVTIIYGVFRETLNHLHLPPPQLPKYIDLIRHTLTAAELVSIVFVFYATLRRFILWPRES